MYLAYALLCEGSSDFEYFEALIPRVVDDVVSDRGRLTVDMPTTPTFRLRRGKTVAAVAREACEKQQAFVLVFVHADTGGASQAGTLDCRSVAYCTKMQEVCDFNPARCVLMRPQREMEAWALADRDAIRDALGYGGRLADLGLPKDAREAERLPDPKKTLRTALRQAGFRRRRDAGTILPAIAQRQSIDALRQARSFAEFEAGLTTALEDLRAI